jgi:RNA polymerase sigma-70 factor (ECF subfamily)
MTNGRDDFMLVLLAQQGDHQALNALLERVTNRLFRYICGIVPNNAGVAEDVLQETLFRVARKLRWLSEPRAFDAWTYRIASNEAYRALRRTRHRLVEEELSETLPSPEPALSQLDVQELRSIVGDLSAASRAVIVLHYQEEQPLESIASILDIPLGTVKSRLAYGLKCLREKTKR